MDGPGQFFSSRVLRLQVPYQKGLDVIILQSLLNLLPEHIIRKSLEVDGVFGLDTRAAVRSFQKYFKLDQRGIVNDETYYCLGHCCGKYSRNKIVFSSRIIEEKSEGQDVKILQNRLSAYKKTCLNRPGSGKFDPYTAGAVGQLQEDFSLIEEKGWVGPRTCALILLLSPLGGRVLLKGRHGLDTYFLQLCLHRLGYYPDTPDGFFGSTAFKALSSFQRDADIRVDGIAGPQTFLALGHSLAFPSLDFVYWSHNRDSLSRLADFFSCSKSDLVKANPSIAERKGIRPGQGLKLPVPLAFHLLQRGESIGDIAARYGITPMDIKQANRLQLDQGLIPGDTLLLPACPLNLKGCILYLNRGHKQTQLKSLHLQDMSHRTLYVFNRTDLQGMYPDRRQNTVKIWAADGWQAACGLNNRQLEILPPFCRRELERSPLSPGNRREQFTPGEENMALSPAVVSSIKQRLQERGTAEFRFSPDGKCLLLFAAVPPARTTAACWYNIETEQLRQISAKACDGLFSTDGSKFLLIEREEYGACYPWFYLRINLFSSRGCCLSQEIMSRSAEIRPYCFNRDNTAFVLRIHSPNTFYPMPEHQSNLYIKLLNSPLVFQLTRDEKPFSPLWI